MSGWPSFSEIKELKKKYPRGTRIRCRYCNDFYHPIESGALGTVDHVDDIGTIHVKWDGGRMLGLVYGEDSYEKVEE